jgi:hypothetical protein
MRGYEASGPVGAPSTLTTSVIRNPTSFPSPSTPLPSTDADLVAKNVEHLLLSLTSQSDGALVGVSGNSSGSTGKGILIGVLSAFGSATVAVLVLAIFFFFKYTRRGRIFLDRMGRPGEFDDEQAFAREEAEALETMDDMTRSEYMRAKCEFVRVLTALRIDANGDDSSVRGGQSARVDADRHFVISVPRDTRKGCLGMGVPTRVGNRQLFCRSPNGNRIL